MERIVLISLKITAKGKIADFSIAVSVGGIKKLHMILMLKRIK